MFSLFLMKNYVQKVKKDLNKNKKNKFASEIEENSSLRKP